MAQDALERFRELGDRDGEGKALWGVVNSYVFEDDVEPAQRTGRRIARRSPASSDDRFQLGWALFTAGLILNKGRRTGTALGSRIDEALAIFRETEDVTGYALVLDGHRGRGLAVRATASGR